MHRHKLIIEQRRLNSGKNSPFKEKYKTSFVATASHFRPDITLKLTAFDRLSMNSFSCLSAKSKLHNFIRRTTMPVLMITLTVSADGAIAEGRRRDCPLCVTSLSSIALYSPGLFCGPWAWSLAMRSAQMANKLGVKAVLRTAPHVFMM
jgi:hypothetical protein